MMENNRSRTQTERSRRASLPPAFSTNEGPFTNLPIRRSRISAVGGAATDDYRRPRANSDAQILNTARRGTRDGLGLLSIPEDAERTRRWAEVQNKMEDTHKERERDAALLTLSNSYNSQRHPENAGLSNATPALPPPSYNSPVVRQRAGFTDDYAHSPELGNDRGWQASPRSQHLPHVAPYTPAPHAIVQNRFYLPFQPSEPDPSNQRSKKNREERKGLKGWFSRLAEEPELPSPPATPAPSRPSSPVRRGTQQDKNASDEKDARQQKVDQSSSCQQDMFLRAMDISREDERAGNDPNSRLHELDEDAQLYSMTSRDKGKVLAVPIPHFLQQHPHLPFDTHLHRDGEGGLRVGRRDEDQGEKTRNRPTLAASIVPSMVSGQDSRKLSYRQRRKKPKHTIVYNRDTIDAQHRFILVLAKALIVFGSPSHRIEPQLDSIARLFELPAQFVHTPGCVQISFGLPEQHASETLLIKAAKSLDLGRIHLTHAAYRAVCRDEIPASEGAKRLEELLRRKPIYPEKLLVVLTFFQGFLLCGISFGGSLNDMWVSGVLSLLVQSAQSYAARSDLSSSGADVFIAALTSLIARALSVVIRSKIFCYQSISSTSIAGLLPGSIMLEGVLDIASHNIYLGAPKIVSGLMTSLYLGFGLTLGSDVWLHFDSKGRALTASTGAKYVTFNGTFISGNASIPALSPANLTGVYTFSEDPNKGSHIDVNGCYRSPEWPWMLHVLPWYTLFATLPALNLVLSMKRAQPLLTVQMPVMIAISCVSFAVTHLCNERLGLAGHPDYTALLGSFIVSMLGNIYSRRMGGTAFTIMLTGIWLLIPTGLAQAGGLSSSYSGGQDEYTTTLDLARKMISVIIGVMSGVYLSARVVYTFGKKKNTAFVTF